MITHDVLPYLVCKLTWVQNCDKHRVCLSEVDVWVFDGSGTQDTRDTVCLSCFKPLSSMYNNMVFFMLRMQN